MIGDSRNYNLCRKILMIVRLEESTPLKDYK
jgi:hypothetical protein